MLIAMYLDFVAKRVVVSMFHCVVQTLSGDEGRGVAYTDEEVRGESGT